MCVRTAAPLTPPGQITRFSRTIFPQHVRQIRKHDVSPVGRRQGGGRGVRSEVVYCSPVMTKQMASSASSSPECKDALPEGAETGDGISQERGSLMKCPPLSVQDKTHFCAGGRIARTTLLPRGHIRFLKFQVWDSLRVRRQDLNELSG